MSLFYSPLEAAVPMAFKQAPLLIFHPRDADRGVDPTLKNM